MFLRSWARLCCQRSERKQEQMFQCERAFHSLSCKCKRRQQEVARAVHQRAITAANSRSLSNSDTGSSWLGHSQREKAEKRAGKNNNNSVCVCVCAQAIQNPSVEGVQEKAWSAVVPLVIKLKTFYEFSQKLGKNHRRLLQLQHVWILQTKQT